MNVLDENIPESQRQLLRSWGIRVRQIGQGVGRQGMKDEEIIPLLRDLRNATFFTRDFDFYDRRALHARYCLVCLDVGQYEVASFVRRILAHRALNTQAKRMGTILRVGHVGIRLWRLHDEQEELLNW